MAIFAAVPVVMTSFQVVKGFRRFTSSTVTEGLRFVFPGSTKPSRLTTMDTRVSASNEDFVHRIVQRFPATVVEVIGPLGPANAGRLFGMLLRCLADCPDGLIVDLTAADVDSDLALAIFPSVARRGAVWPAVPMSLCAPESELADRLRRVVHRMRIFPSRAAALAAPRAQSTAGRLDLNLAASPAAPGRARALAARACRDWSLPRLAAHAQVLTSELVANAVRHGAAPITLSLVLRRPYLHIVVRDGSVEPPRRLDSPQAQTRPQSPPQMRPPARERRATPPLTHGAGIPLLDAVSSSWGYLVDNAGKVVWAMLLIGGQR